MTPESGLETAVRATPARSAVGDARVEAVIAQIGARIAGAPGRSGADMPHRRDAFDLHACANTSFSTDPEQGELIYLLCRALRARLVVDCAPSLGVSTLYVAAAIRDNGGGVVISTETVPENAAQARRHLEEAGLAAFVDIRIGDARDTVRDLGGDVDFALIGGWAGVAQPSLALQVLRRIAPQMQGGAIAMHVDADADADGADYRAWVRDRANGFRSMCLPLTRATELSVKG